MLHLAICDDNPAISVMVCKMIETMPCVKKLKIHQFNTADDLNDYANANSPLDIVIMDICLRDDIGNDKDGIALAQHLWKQKALPVIYITGFAEENHSEVYQPYVEHVYFIAKPIQLKYLEKALDIAITKAMEYQTRYIRFRTETGLRSVPVESIQYVEKNKRREHIKTLINRRLESEATYDSVMEQLKKLDCQFLQCHKSFLVNMKRVEEIRTKNFLMYTGDEVPISQAYRKEVRQAFLDYIGAASDVRI